jgi:hypothetical protein
MAQRLSPAPCAARAELVQRCLQPLEFSGLTPSCLPDGSVGAMDPYFFLSIHPHNRDIPAVCFL